jgi:hypothetical protein
MRKLPLPPVNMPLKIEERIKNAHIFSCGHHSESPSRPLPPSHLYMQHRQVGNRIIFDMDCMECDQAQVCRTIRNVRRDRAAGFESSNGVWAGEMYDKRKDEAIEATRKMSQVMADFEDRWNERNEVDFEDGCNERDEVDFEGWCVQLDELADTPYQQKELDAWTVNEWEEWDGKPDMGAELKLDRMNTLDGLHWVEVDLRRWI